MTRHSVRPDASVAYRVWGSGPLLVALHGFSHDSTTWAGLATALTGHTIAAPDLRGHGATRVERGGCFDLRATADDVLAIAADLGAAEFDLVGYSMGARVAMHVALARPDAVASLCLVGGDPGIEDPGERRRRAESDKAGARRILTDGLDAFMADWEQQPLFAGLDRRSPDEMAALAATRRSHDPAQLAAALEGLSVGRQANLWPELASLDIAVLAVAGAEDTKYVAVADRIRRTVRTAAAAVVEGCGHTVHLEAPQAFAALLDEFLADD